MLRKSAGGRDYYMRAGGELNGLVALVGASGYEEGL